MELRKIQQRLNELGFGPLTTDGKSGPKTLAAIKAFQTSKGLTVDGLVGDRTLHALFPDIHTKGRLMSTAEIIGKYGQPGPHNQVLITLPFPMRVGWDKKTVATKIQCHKLIAEPLTKSLTEILAHYGIDAIKRLGIDLYWGCYNFRKMRGGSDWSRHAWGIAIDLDADRNGLKATHKTAQFAKPEYQHMIDIFYNNGFVGLGPEKDYDWMHFQIGH